MGTSARLDPLLAQAIELLNSIYRDAGENVKADELIAQFRREMDFAQAP
jgi:hypothetical protein